MLRTVGLDDELRADAKEIDNIGPDGTYRRNFKPHNRRSRNSRLSPLDLEGVELSDDAIVAEGHEHLPELAG